MWNFGDVVDNVTLKFNLSVLSNFTQNRNHGNDGALD